MERVEDPVKPIGGTSRRAQHFQSALTLVCKKGATAWTLEQWLACVGTWGEENPEKATAMRVQLGQYLQETDQEKTEEILVKYNAYEGIDCLAEAVAEAKNAAAAAAQSKSNRRRSSTSASAHDATKGKDIWRSELAPRTAVHAVTVPLLEAERSRLERDIAEVERLSEEALARFREHRDKAKEAKLQASKILDSIDKAKEAYEPLNVDEMGEWTMGQLTNGHEA